MKKRNIIFGNETKLKKTKQNKDGQVATNERFFRISSSLGRIIRRQEVIVENPFAGAEQAKLPSLIPRELFREKSEMIDKGNFKS